MTKQVDERIIRAENVDKIYPNGCHALKQVSLDIKRGEVVVIIGPSGSGKSTFLRTLNQLETISEGTILIDDVSLTDKKPTSTKSVKKWAWCSNRSTYFRIKPL